MEHLSTWNCPECASQTFTWYFKGPDGCTLDVQLPAIPDFSSLAQLKEMAIAKHQAEPGYTCSSP